MSLFRAMWKTVSSNYYIFFGIFIGIIISQNYSTFDCSNLKYFDKFSLEKNAQNKSFHSNNESPSKIHSADAIKKHSENKKSEKRITRPRYYSTELGIREKIFIGVLTAEERLNTQSVYLNKTIGHLIDQIKFFITVHSKPKVQYNLTNIVGFTDTRPKYKIFQVIKYLSDNFNQQYDYFFIMNDFNFLNTRQLKEVVHKISVSQDVYLGTIEKDSSFCDLNAGILFSNSIITAVKHNIDWCIKNAISENHSENLGRCIHFSVGLECQENVQEQRLNSYKLKHFGLKNYFNKLSHLEVFNNALSIYPVLQEDEFYLLNSYFTRLRLEKINEKIENLSVDLTNEWPPGEKSPVKPATRFDILPQLYFNATHLFSPDDFTNIRPHVATDFVDIQRMVSTIIEKVSLDYPNRYIYRRLVNGYRTFDWSRGLDYVIDLGFRDLSTGKEIVKRFEVCKPLGKVEFVSVPYVTENTRVVILLPVQQKEIDLALQFINNYEKRYMENKEKVLLVLTLFYQYDDPNKGNDDPFKQVKDSTQILTSKYHNEDSKIMWVSIRLPKSNEKLVLSEKKVLLFAMVDLGMKKIGADSLVLVLDVYADPGIPFINRVRMNTIVNFQVFSPIPFRMYDPLVTQTDSIEISKSSGHFDNEEYGYISFYGRDYVNMRLKAQDEIPIVKVDSDIEKLLQIASDNDGNIFNMFVKYSKGLHAMRATEIALTVKYHLNVSRRKNLFIGSKVQMAKMILNNKDEIERKV